MQQVDTRDVANPGTSNLEPEPEPEPRNPGTGTPEPRNPGTPEPRIDTPSPSLDRAVVLAEAPDAAREAGLFRVPKVR